MNKNLKAMSDYTVISRYARYFKDKKRRATWDEQVDIVEDMHLQKYEKQILEHPQLEEDIKWAFDLVRKKEVVGSQRGLQFAGVPVLKKNCRIYNCASSYVDRVRFFQEAFWVMLCGSGIGFSVQRHHIAKLPPIRKRTDDEVTYVIPDTIEGWADALGILLSSYFTCEQSFPEYFGKKVKYEYHEIRPEGSPLSSGVGKAPGPKGLKNALEKIERMLDSIIGNNTYDLKLRPIQAYDILMHTSDAVLSGGVRRSATACLFSWDDEEMKKAKTGNWRVTNPQRGRSNNSAVIKRDEISYEEFKGIVECIKDSGEPGFLFVDNLEFLQNPCFEIGMCAYETFDDGNGGIKRHEDGEPVFGRSGISFCNLSEINGAVLKTEADFKRTARAAAIIGTLQAGYTDLGYLGEVTEGIVRREALLGVSVTGMMDNPDLIFNPDIQRRMAKIVLDENERVAKMLGINPAARATCIKPSGSSSLVLGTGSGIHPHHAKRYFRRIQANKNEAPMQWYRKHNPMAVEESFWSENKTDVMITFCVEVDKGARVKNRLSAIEMLEFVKATQKNWVMEGTRRERCVADWLNHNVSNSIHIRKNEWNDVAKFIYNNREFFTGVSLISLHGDKDYKQAPNCTVYLEHEILKEYGKGSLLASGLIVDGQHAYKNDLWEACDVVLGKGDPLFVELLRQNIINNSDPNRYSNLKGTENDKVLEDWLQLNVENLEAKRDWVRRAKQFAYRYFDDDLKKMTYCLKDVNNLKLWYDLQRDHVPVDYTQLIEETDETKVEETIACAGGACELF